MRNLPKPRHQRELEGLLAAYCDGKLDADGKSRLAEILGADPEARRFYLHYLDLHLDLARRAEAPSLFRGAAATRRKSAWKYVAAAAAVAAIGVAAIIWPGAETGEGQAEVPDVQSALQPVAFVSHSDGVDWDYPHSPELGLNLDAGDSVQLQSGRLRLDFFDGSSATMVAPARFTLSSGTEIELGQGKLAVRSDGPAPGFSVRTPGAIFVDVGTAFALTVSDSEPTQVHVTEGEVIATLLSADDVALAERAAYAGEFLTVDRSDGIVAADLDPAEFAEMLPPSALPLEISPAYVAAVMSCEPLAYWRFEEAEANRVPDEIGSGQGARALGAVRLEGRQNKTITLEGEASGRGLFVDSPFSGFERGEYSVELWINAQHRQYAGLLSLVEIEGRSGNDRGDQPKRHRLMAVECSGGEQSRLSKAPLGKIGFYHKLRRKGDRPHGRKESPKHRGDKHDRDKHGKDDHKADGKKKSSRQHRDRHGKSGSRGRSSGGHRDFESRVYSQKNYQPGAWHHVVVVREADRILLYLDGELEAEAEASPDFGSASLNLVIGRHSLDSGWLGRPFTGSLDELAIYGRALSPDEIREHASLARE